MSRKTAVSVNLAFVLLLASSGKAQVLDPPGDTTLPCVDIVQGDVRADRTTLTVTIEVAGEFCPQAHYFFHIDSDVDGESNIAFQTKFDSQGSPSTTGSPGLVAQIDRSARTIVWRAPLSEQLEAPDDPNPQHMRVWFRTVRAFDQDRLPDSGGLDFQFGADAAAIIDPRGGTVSMTDPASAAFGASLTVPPGAVSIPQTFSITENANPPAFSDGFRPISAVSVEPSGLTFLIPATLSLPYRESDLDPATSLGENTLGLFHFDATLGTWVGFPSDRVDTSARRVSSDINSLSVYGLAYARLVGACTNSSFLPVILVHGYQLTLGGSRCLYGPNDTWGNLPTLLTSEGVDVFELQYNTCRSISELAGTLRDAITKATQCYALDLAPPRGEAGAATLVAHSMGGLLARAAIESLAERRVYALLTAATPHLGADPPSIINCQDPGGRVANFREMAACSPFLEGPTGLNRGVRSHEPPDLFSCGPDYEFYVGREPTIPIVDASSALALNWAQNCVCPGIGDAAAFEPSGLVGSRFHKEIVGPEKELSLCGTLDTPSTTGCGINGNLPCEHTTLVCPGEGIVDVRNKSHVMWRKIRDFATRASWFPESSAPQCNQPSVTLNFTGSVNLSSPFGGPTSSSFRGSVAWDSTASPFVSNSLEARYRFLGATFSVDGIDYSSRIQSLSGSSYVRIFNNAVGGDEFDITFDFSPILDVGVGPDIRSFTGSLFGPMFSSTALPSDFNFLNSATSSYSFFQNASEPLPNAFGTFAAEPSAAVP